VLDTDTRRAVLAVVVVIAIISLVAWARNDPGVGGREPDPPQSTPVVTDVDTVPPTT
jgi:hypothetical protein